MRATTSQGAMADVSLKKTKQASEIKVGDVITVGRFSTCRVVDVATSKHGCNKTRLTMSDGSVYLFRDTTSLVMGDAAAAEPTSSNEAVPAQADAIDKYVAKCTTEPSLAVAKRIRRFCENLPDPTREGAEVRVLDLGCGPGVPFASTLSDMGFRVHGVDTSAEMLTWAADAAPKASFELKDMRDAAPKARAHGVVANCSVLHLPRKEHGAMFAKIFSWLEPGGVFLLGGLDGDVDGVESEWLGQPFFHSYYPLAKTAALIEAQGFQIQYAEREADLKSVWTQAVKPCSAD